LRGYRFKGLLVVGSERDILEGRYRSRITPASMLGSLGAFGVRYDVRWSSPPPRSLRPARWSARAFYFAAECIEVVNGLWTNSRRSSAENL
jgi:hypothetical protein